MGLIPGSGKFPGGGNGNPLQYLCLENSLDRGARQATDCRVRKESDTTSVAHEQDKHSYAANSRKSETLFWGAPKSLEMVIAAMELKDVYSLEGKL